MRKHETTEFGITVLLENIRLSKFVQVLRNAGFHTEPVMEDEELLLVTKHHSGGVDDEAELINAVRAIIEKCGGDPDATSVYGDGLTLGPGDLDSRRQRIDADHVPGGAY